MEVTEDKILNSSGPAAFSTNYGTYAPQFAQYGVSNVVVHEDDEDDCQAHAANLRKRFPQECKQMTDPEIDISTFFDHKDICVLGANVLQAAIRLIVHQNRARTDAIKDFAEKWRKQHPFRLQKYYMHGMKSFSKDEIDEYGTEFLEAVLQYLKETHEPAKQLLIIGERLNLTSFAHVTLTVTVPPNADALEAPHTGLPPISPSPLHTPVTARRACREEVFARPVSGADNPLRPRRGSAPPTVAPGALEEFRELAASFQSTEARPETPAEARETVRSPFNPFLPNSVSPIATSRKMTDQTWASQPTIASISSAGMRPSVDMVLSGEPEPPVQRTVSTNTNASEHSNPSVDGKWAPVTLAQKANEEARRAPNFNEPEWRRPRGDSILPRTYRQRVEAMNIPYRTPSGPNVRTLGVNHGASQMVPGLVNYPAAQGHLMPAPHMGPMSRNARPPSGIPPPGPARSRGRGRAPSTRESSFGERSSQDSRRESGHSGQSGFYAQQMQQQLQPQYAPMMPLSPPTIHANPVFIPAPMTLSLQHGMPYQAVEPSDTAGKNRYPSFSAQTGIVDRANADASATLHVRKHPQKSFTDDARLLDSMVEEDGPDFRGARRHTRSYVPNENYSQPHGGSRRGSRGSFAGNEFPIMQVPEPTVVNAQLPPPPPQPAYFGYAVRDPNEGKIATFEPADNAYKTIRRKEKVVQALRSNDETEQPLQAPVPQRPLPAIPEQPIVMEEHFLAKSGPEAELSALPDPCIQSVQPEHRYGIPPPHVVGDIKPFEPSQHRADKDHTKLWVAGGSNFNEQLLAVLFGGRPGVTDITTIKTKGPNKSFKHKGRGPHDRFAFVQ